MAGILANTTSVTMTAGDTAAVNTFSGYLTAEQVTLSVNPAGASFSWGISKPSGSTVKAVLSSTTDATPVFTPDVGGYYVVTCTVDSTTVYRLTISVTQVAITTSVEATRYQPKSDASVTSPPLGAALFFSSDLACLASKNSSGVVRPLGSSSSGYLTQANWYINATTGNDLADGKTTGTALKTFAEWSSRIGTGTVSVASTVNIETDLAESSYRVLGHFPSGLTIKGVKTVLQSGSVSSVAAYDYTTSPVSPGSITDTTLSGASWGDSGPAGGSLVESLLTMTSGAINGATSWLAKDLGAKAGRPGPWINTGTLATGDPTNGDTYTASSITQLSGGPLYLYHQRDPSAGGALTLQDLSLTGGASEAGASVMATSPYNAVNVKFAAVKHDAPGVSTLTNCFLDNGTFAFQVSSGTVRIQGGVSRANIQTTSPAAHIKLLYNSIGQWVTGVTNRVCVDVYDGAVVELALSANYVMLDDQNAAAAAFRVGSASTLLLGGQASTVGQAGTGFGIWVDSGGAVFWDDSLANASDHMDFDSPSADTKIGGTTKTLAALGSSGYAEAVKLATIAPREVTP